MASILKVGQNWRVLIRRRGHKPVCRTFKLKVLAERFARETELAIEKREFDEHDPPLDGVVQSHRRMREQALYVHPTTLKHLDMIERRIGSLKPSEVSPKSILERFPETRPAALKKYLALLRASMRAHDPPIRTTELDSAVRALARLGRVRGSRARDRRPAGVEIEAVLAAYKGPMPFRDMVMVSVISGLRLGELTSLRWVDLDEAKKTILVRDRKHPTHKIGNNQRVPLLGESFEIVMRQPRRGELIFPYNKGSISNAWNKVRKRIGGSDLRWHDFRHEAISRMVEQGYSIPEVALVSGHASWQMLRRYTNLKPEDLHSGPAAARISSR